MTTTQARKQQRYPVTSIQRQSLHRTTVILALILFGLGLLIAAWFLDHRLVTGLFARLEALQSNPPLWVEVPQAAAHYLLAPSGILLLIVMGVMKVSPRPRPWSRSMVVGILAVLLMRYLLWRSLSTLNFSSPLDGVFSLGLFAAELLVLTSTCIQFLLLLRIRDRRSEADQLSLDVIEDHFTPSVDVLIPTYDEPAFILKRTVVGCQAMEYPNLRIYLLDDTRRPEIRALAAELGCEYLTRPNNLHAKAGNLNHAIAHTNGELILVFDADFVPTQNFLTRTVGFFQNPNVALVQTPQSFYNIDPIAHNLGLEDVLTPEEEVFYRQIQPMRDGSGGVICSGTSFIVRRQALENLGGFVTESLSEDYFTGIRLAAAGHTLIYLDEKLSAGLAPDDIAAQAIQRIRWARGTLQAFFIRSNPLTIPGLSPLQRLAHLEGLLFWFTSLARIGFLITPLSYWLFQVVPIRATPQEALYFFLPYFLTQIAVFSWLNHRARSALLSEIYSLFLCFPLAWTVIQMMVNPFGKSFTVTPKGRSRARLSFNWGLALPLIIMFSMTAVSLWMNLRLSHLYAQQGAEGYSQGLEMGVIWTVYNLLLLGVSLVILIDIPRPSPHEWVDLRRTVNVTLGDRTFWGVTTMLSEGGATIELTQSGFPRVQEPTPLTVDLELMEEQLKLRGIVTQTQMTEEFPTLHVMFEPLPLNAYRTLVKLLFCRPGQWQQRSVPGEWRSLWLLSQALLKPRFLARRSLDIKPISVTKV